jgi:hypothetical protein
VRVAVVGKVRMLEDENGRLLKVSTFVFLVEIQFQFLYTLLNVMHDRMEALIWADDVICRAHEIESLYASKCDCFV